ncbi:alkaline phosphatase D family protein [Bdellovibrio sp. HCB-162]|uniref:alkaline phosphatase D family protein n=1 Tax=Bdellovibrio sp. HCB-162 TaxID=3394234 RepID=UPI0039BC5D12
MKIQRRHFLKLGLFQAVALGTAQKTFSAPVRRAAQRTEPSILQGATDDTRTQFSIVYDRTDLEIYVVNSQGQRWLPDEVRPISFPNHPKKILKVFFSNLVPTEIYHLNIIDAQTGKTIDEREFQTLDLNKPSVRFAICSCMNEKEHSSDIWQNMVNNKPDVLFFIGDSVYADSGSTGAPDPAYLWQRFCEARSTLEIYFSKRLIPIFATWDDHDFGFNDANSLSYSFVKESQQNFLSFFAQDESHCRLLEKGPGVSSALKFRNHLFLLLDDRSFRLPRGSKERYAHWGQEQETWMLNHVRQNPGPSWLMNGSQFFPAVPWKESVSGDHPVQFSAFLQELKSIPNKVIFASGDVHYSEISRIEPEAVGYETFEFTSSSIHSRNFPGVPDVIPNNRRIAGTGQRNYIMVDSEISSGVSVFKATSYAGNNSVKFQKDFKI